MCSSLDSRWLTLSLSPDIADRWRVVLKAEHPDYINASFANVRRYSCLPLLIHLSLYPSFNHPPLTLPLLQPSTSHSTPPLTIHLSSPHLLFLLTLQPSFNCFSLFLFSSFFAYATAPPSSSPTPPSFFSFHSLFPPLPHPPLPSLLPPPPLLSLPPERATSKRRRLS